jgi:hypothetical protein
MPVVHMGGRAEKTLAADFAFIGIRRQIGMRLAR